MGAPIVVKDQAILSEQRVHVVAGLGPVGRAVIDELVGLGLPARAIARHSVNGLPREVDVVEADITTREFASLVFEAAGREPKVRAMPSAMLTILALVRPTLRAVREQQYQREAPWVVDHTKFAGAFGAHVTPHREAITTTLDWFRGAQ